MCSLLDRMRFYVPRIRAVKHEPNCDEIVTKKGEACVRRSAAASIIARKSIEVLRRNIESKRGPMLALYMILVAVHIVALVVTGILWTIIDLVPKSGLRHNFRDIRAVHFGSLYLVPWLLGLAWAFERLGVPALHQAAFPLGLGLLIAFSSVAYVFPRPPGLDPFYYWTRGWALVLSMIGLAGLVICLIWTAVVLVLYALHLE